MEGGSEVEGVCVGEVGSVVGGFCVWGGGMSTSSCDDDDDFGCESGGGDDGGEGGDGGFPDPGGEGEELWSEDIMSSCGR